MRLTNYLRDCFIRAVSNDIPKPIEPSYEVVQQLLYDGFEPEIKAVYDKEELRKCLTTSWVYLGNGNGRYLYSCGRNYQELPIYVAFIEDRKKREQAIEKLRGVAYGVTTLKGLKEALPELAKYMADEDKKPTPGLPVVANLYDDLKALGLPS